MKKTVIYCDVCGKEIPAKKFGYKFKLTANNDFHSMDINYGDVCHECATSIQCAINMYFRHRMVPIDENPHSYDEIYHKRAINLDLFKGEN